MGFIIAIIVGAFAGWLAGRIMHTNFSFIGNIAVGMIGGFVGNLVLGLRLRPDRKHHRICRRSMHLH